MNKQKENNQTKRNQNKNKTTKTITPRKRDRSKDTQGLVYQINLISSAHAQLFKQNLNNVFI